MSSNHPERTPTESQRASLEEATEVESIPIGAGRKPYACPRLTKHGGVPVLTFGPSVQATSDRGAKEGFEAIDVRAVLTQVARLPIERWSYKGEAVRHLGPMAQDFAAAFGLGADDRHIFTLDAAGVALAAIQGLHGLVRAQQSRLEGLERELTALRGETAALHLQLAMQKEAPVALTGLRRPR
jgi:hypothetical protein